MSVHKNKSAQQIDDNNNIRPYRCAQHYCYPDGRNIGGRKILIGMVIKHGKCEAQCYTIEAKGKGGCRDRPIDASKAKYL